MYVSPVERMKKIHIWIGITTLSEEKYNEYFNQDNGTSLFYRDLGIDEEYDEDFIGILPIFKEPLTAEKIIADEIPIDKGDLSIAIDACNKLNIRTANAVFYLTDSSVNISKTKETYNGLKYIGIYNSSL
jgi:hypothetical protein